MNKSAHQILGLVIVVMLVVILFNFRVVYASPRVLYVAPDGTTGGACDSWANACTWQYAISIAISGDEVWVRKGLYYPGTNATDTFTLKSSIAIYGGFEGTEIQRDQRNWRGNATILSGDVDNNDVTDPNGVVTSTLYIRGINAYHVISNTNLSDAILDGFIITAGHAGGPTLHDYYGGGMHNQSSSLTMRNLIFSGNSGYMGSGISNVESVLQIENVTFSGNGGFFGGGMYNEASNLIMANLTFSNNSADYGGGVYNYGSTLTMTNVLFSVNKGYEGGGMYNRGGSLTLINAVFNGNQAGYAGGGMYNRGGSLTLINAVFNDNQAGYKGGGIYNWGDTTLINATISGNSAASTGGGIYNYASNQRLTNVIVWGNVAPEGANIYNYASAPNISYSNVQGCGDSGLNWQSSCGTDNGRNIDADPLFVNIAIGNLHLLPGSPCIDNGDNAAIPADVTFDLDSNPRIVDSNNDGNAIVDMGAYEAPRFKKIYLPLALRGVSF